MGAFLDSTGPGNEEGRRIENALGGVDFAADDIEVFALLDVALSYDQTEALAWVGGSGQ